jgi:hypothetical protein
MGRPSWEMSCYIIIRMREFARTLLGNFDSDPRRRNSLIPAICCACIFLGMWHFAQRDAGIASRERMTTFEKTSAVWGKPNSFHYDFSVNGQHFHGVGSEQPIHYTNGIIWPLPDPPVVYYDPLDPSCNSMYSFESLASSYYATAPLPLILSAFFAAVAWFRDHKRRKLAPQ